MIDQKDTKIRKIIADGVFEYNRTNDIHLVIDNICTKINDYELTGEGSG